MWLISWTGWTKEDWIEFIKLLGKSLLTCVVFFIIIYLYFCSDLAM